MPCTRRARPSKVEGRLRGASCGGRRGRRERGRGAVFWTFRGSHGRFRRISVPHGRGTGAQCGRDASSTPVRPAFVLTRVAHLCKTRRSAIEAAHRPPAAPQHPLRIVEAQCTLLRHVSRLLRWSYRFREGVAVWLSDTCPKGDVTCCHGVASSAAKRPPCTMQHRFARREAQ